MQICSCHNSVIRRKMVLSVNACPPLRKANKDNSFASLWLGRKWFVAVRPRSTRVQCCTKSEKNMVRCLFAVFVVTVGLAALASSNRKNLALREEPAPSSGPRLRESEAVALSGASRTLLRPLPALDIAFSLN